MRVPGLGIRQRVEHRGLPVEVGDDEVAGVVGQQWVEADEDVAPEVLLDHFGGQRQVAGRLVLHALAPATDDRGSPPRLPGPPVLIPARVDVRTGTEPVGIEGELVRIG
jgi:hypothetical protein